MLLERGADIHAAANVSQSLRQSVNLPNTHGAESHMHTHKDTHTHTPIYIYAHIHTRVHKNILGRLKSSWRGSKRNGWCRYLAIGEGKRILAVSTTYYSALPLSAWTSLHLFLKVKNKLDGTGHSAHTFMTISEGEFKLIREGLNSRWWTPPGHVCLHQ